MEPKTIVKDIVKPNLVAEKQVKEVQEEGLPESSKATEKPVIAKKPISPVTEKPLKKQGKTVMEKVADIKDGTTLDHHKKN